MPELLIRGGTVIDGSGGQVVCAKAASLPRDRGTGRAR